LIFLKPTIGKVILTLTIFLILPIIATIPMLGGPNECGGLRTCNLGTGYTWIPLGGLFFIYALIYGGNQAFMTTIDYLWKTPTLLIISYLLSCLILYFIKRVSKKPKD